MPRRSLLVSGSARVESEDAPKVLYEALPDSNDLHPGSKDNLAPHRLHPASGIKYISKALAEADAPETVYPPFSPPPIKSRSRIS